nr:uncharacterized protein LOC117982236 [Maniola hyperantus]
MAEEDCRMVEVQPLIHQEVVVREKRLRSSSDDILEEDGFTTVRSKRSVKMSKKSTSGLSSAGNEEENLPIQDEKIIVTVTGKEVLPKQFKLAKLLRSENILKINSIQYKSPFKICIEFEDKENAQKLIECKIFVDMGFRCQLLNDMSLAYGIIRNVDLDIDDEEIKGNLESDLEIVSIRRLKRTTSTGKWVESETIRIGFRASVLPAYVRVYGCRFKVLSYMYPVTQCNGCWKFGHSIRFCPSKKIVCPKCTEYYSNCEISTYKCVNCKGNHMALDKSCPIFLKEKNIRIIMRDLNYTYKKVLSIYLSENEVKKNDNNEQSKENFSTAKTVTENQSLGRSYKDVLMSQHDINTEKQESTDEESQPEKDITDTKQRVKRNKKFKKRNKSNTKTESSGDILREESDTDMSMEECDDENKGDGKKKFERKKGSISFRKFIQKLKEIYLSDGTLDGKIKVFIGFIIEEIIRYISIMFRDNDICTWLLSKFNYG